MKKWLLRIGVFLIVFILLLGAFFLWQTRDRFPDYWVDINILASTPQPLKVGFSALSITPKVPDTWTDKNGDAQYNPDDGDTYEDVNGNGKFDAVWMAGFQNNRPAQGIHDELWARTIVVDDGKTRLALVSLDCIGIGADDIIKIRKAVSKEAAVDYVIVCSSHTHEGPDVIGLWGKGMFKSGLDEEYMNYLITQSAASVEKAVQNIRPAKVRFAQDLTGATHLVEDSRKPTVLDPAIYLMQAIDIETDTTLGVLVEWANHPETLWDKNLLITSDFPHYFREGLEKGVFYGDSLMMQGLGGTAVFVNGAIGGLMTTSPNMSVQSPFNSTLFKKPSFEKAKAQGERLAILGLAALNTYDEVLEGSIALRAKSVILPMDNSLYRLAAGLGIFNRGFSEWMKVRSEVCIWKLGPAAFLHQPGEIYPEIINGGIEQPHGQDFDLAPIEVPPLRALMPAKYNITIGLSNDMIGYIIPKSEWDEEAPFIYEYENSPYGEINSLGPETAPILHKALVEIIEDIK